MKRSLRIYIVSILTFCLVLTLGWFANLNSGLGSDNLVLAAEEVVPPKTQKQEVQKEEFALIIPSINVRKDIIANVDPVDEGEYMEVLEQFVAHGKYTLLPNQATTQGNVYLFAHKEGYVDGRNIGFFSNLDKLRSGDNAYIKFNGLTYEYEYVASRVVKPTNVGVYTSQSNYPRLTLQTCYNGTSERLIVSFEFVGLFT